MDSMKRPCSISACITNPSQPTSRRKLSLFSPVTFLLILLWFSKKNRIKWILCRVHSVLHHLFFFFFTNVSRRLAVSSKVDARPLHFSLIFCCTVIKETTSSHTRKKIQTLDNAFDEQVTPPPPQFNLFNRKSTPRTTIQEAPLLNHYLILAVAAAAAANNNNNSTGGEGIEKGQFPGICTSAVSSWCCAVLPGQIGDTIFSFSFLRPFNDWINRQKAG